MSSSSSAGAGASEKDFANASTTGEIPSFDGDAKAKATDFAQYFCSYAQLYHQKQMLADHQRMAAYHSAILGNQEIFRDKVVMDIGTGSGILAVWAAQVRACRVCARPLEMHTSDDAHFLSTFTLFPYRRQAPRRFMP